MLSTPSRLLGLSVLLLLTLLAMLPPAGARAQHLYLDANGDGVHTSADVLAPSGPTTLEVWLVTNANRDGGTAICASGEDLTINSYEFLLRATNGQMTWGTFTNLQSEMLTPFGAASSATEFYVGFGGGTILPPGVYHLGTLTASPALGTPALSFVTSPLTLPGAPMTSFGSQCLGQDQDNTMKLGLDWFDADGVDYGGTAQAAPVLGPVADMTVAEQAIAEQALTATDADGQPLQFQKVSGPAYMTVATLDTGAGTAHGKVTLSPGPIAAGTAMGGVRVTDGFLANDATFAITVLATNAPPTIQAPLPITMTSTSGILRVNSRSTDPDGDTVTMRERDLASFMPDFDSPFFDSEVQSLLHPAAGDVGDWFLFLEATDGIATTNVAVPVRVTGPEPGPAPPREMFQAAFHAQELKLAPADVAAGDIDGDGIGDLVLPSEAGGFIEWMRGDGRGTFAPAGRLAARSPVLAKLADMDRNGFLDLVYTDRADGTVNVVLGPLLAPSPVVRSYAGVAGMSGLALGDFDGDGATDAAVVGRMSPNLLLFSNDGSGELGAPRLIPIPSGARALATGDVNGDGALDFAVVHDTPHSMSLHRNVGDGSFLPPIVRTHAATPPFPTTPGTIAMGDLNRDGRDDVVTWHLFGGIQVYLTDPAGDLLPRIEYSGNGMTAITLVDVSGDGNLDLLAVGSLTGPGPSIHYRMGVGNGTFLANVGLPFMGRPVAIAALDVDADEDRDIVIASSFDRFVEHLPGALAVYPNGGGGQFRGGEVVHPGPSVQGRTLLTDVNADDHLDIVGANGAHLGRGDGTFGPLIGSATSMFEAHLAVSDLNRDGHVDLIVREHPSVPVVTVKLGNGTGAFLTTAAVGVGDQTLQGSVAFAIGDFNSDGIPDLLAGSMYYDQNGPRALEVRLGRGDGTFHPASPVALTAAVTSIVLFDLEGDGDLDALVSDFYFSHVSLLTGQGDGTFTARIASTPPSFAGTGSLSLGDLTGDGLLDVMTRQFQFEGSIAVIRQTSPGSFTSPRDIWSTGGFLNNFPTPLSLADLDLDGRLDLVTGTHGAVVIGMGRGTGEFGRRGFFGPTGTVPLVGDVNEDGWPDIVLNGHEFAGTGPIRTLLNQFGRPRLARGFPSGSAKTIPVGVRGRDLCLRVEPVAGSYANANVDLAAFTLRSEGTGSVALIHAIPPKKAVLGDEDRNGIEDLGVCFSAADLGALFSEIRGRRSVTVTLEGRLTPPGRFQAEITLTVLGTGPSSAPRIAPNPLNPSGALRFVTSRPGAARIRIFDVQGRRVRDLLDRSLEAGDHAIPFDGKDGAGRGLASGIYFASVETVEGSWRVRVAILK
jgi:hypothetical protein